MLTLKMVEKKRFLNTTGELNEKNVIAIRRIYQSLPFLIVGHEKKNFNAASKCYKLPALM